MATLASDWLRHFRLLRWHHWTEFNETCQEASSQCRLPSLCFWVDLKWPGLLLAETFSTSSLKLLNRILPNLIGRKISISSIKICFWGQFWNAALNSNWLRYFQLYLWNCWTEFYETWQGLQARSQCPLPSLCFWAYQKTMMAAGSLIGCDFFFLLLWNR